MEHLGSGSNMKITDMSFDCIESCFRQLSIEDLLNIADSNKQLRHVARYVFGRMHGQKLARFTEVLIFRKEDERLRLTDKQFTISQLKLALQLLRCFGDLISEMEVSFITWIKNFKFILSSESIRSECTQTQLDHMSERVKALEFQHLIGEYINEYCTESLRKIKFGVNRLGELDKLTKPFVKVERLEISRFFPTEKKLHELFPKLRTLELTHSSIDVNDCNDIVFYNEYMANHFPYLENLIMNVWEKPDDIYKYNKEYTAIALRLNPQIKCLKGNVWLDLLFDTNLIANANEHFQNLKILHLEEVFLRHTKTSEFLNKPISENIHLNNLKELRIRLDCDGNGEVPRTLPFICDNLESLRFCAAGHDLEFFQNLLEKYPTVKKFAFSIYRNRVNFDNYSRISKAFPLLEEIFIGIGPCDKDFFAPDEIVRVIQMFHSLKLFEISIVSEYPRENDFGHLQRLLRGWSVVNKIPFCRDHPHQIIEVKRIY